MGHISFHFIEGKLESFNQPRSHDHACHYDCIYADVYTSGGLVPSKSTFVAERVCPSNMRLYHTSTALSRPQVVQATDVYTSVPRLPVSVAMVMGTTASTSRQIVAVTLNQQRTHSQSVRMAIHTAADSSTPHNSGASGCTPACTIRPGTHLTNCSSICC